MVTPEPDHAWLGFVDDASAVPDRSALVELDHPYVGRRVVDDLTLQERRPFSRPLRLVLSGGAAQLTGPLRLAERVGYRVAVLETALRDPADPAGNARRVTTAVDAARRDGVLGEETSVEVRLNGDPTPSWLAALDELAAAELGLVLPLGPAFAAWADAALDRELAFSLHGGSPDDPSGAAEALRTTAHLWDGDDAPLVAGRRWCRSWPAYRPERAVAHLEALAR